jgi:hypothetical protein
MHARYTVKIIETRQPVSFSGLPVCQLSPFSPFKMKYIFFYDSLTGKRANGLTFLVHEHFEPNHNPPQADH